MSHAANLGSPVRNLTCRGTLRLSICTTVLLLTAYALSFGPACWLMTRTEPANNGILYRSFLVIYRPISMAIIRSPACMREPIHWYLDIGVSPDAEIVLDRGFIGWSKPGYTYTVLSC